MLQNGRTSTIAKVTVYSRSYIITPEWQLQRRNTNHFRPILKKDELEPESDDLDDYLTRQERDSQETTNGPQETTNGKCEEQGGEPSPPQLQQSQQKKTYSYSRIHYASETSPEKEDVK